MQRLHIFAAVALALCAGAAAAQAPASSELVPVKRVVPAYPRSGEGASGWVVVRFVVNRDGTVATAQVVRSEPKGVFDQAALNAIINWKFQPVPVEGMAGVQRFNFEPPP